MKITTVATNINSYYSGEKGWYWFNTSCEWLISPQVRNKDVVSLFADNCSWSDNDNNFNFGGFAYEHKSDVSNPTCINLNYDDFVVKNEGAYYTFNLPINREVHNTGDLTYYTGITVWMSGKARVRCYSSNQAMCLYSTYSHTVYSLNITPEISWGTSSSLPGASISATWTQSSETYIARCNFDYKPARNVCYK